MVFKQRFKYKKKYDSKTRMFSLSEYIYFILSNYILVEPFRLKQIQKVV